MGLVSVGMPTRARNCWVAEEIFAPNATISPLNALVIAFGWFTATLPFNSIALYVTAFNLLLVLLIFGSIVLGIINRREALINVGWYVHY